MSGHAAPSQGSRAVRLASWLAPLSDAIVATTMLRGSAAGSGQPLSMLVAGPLARVQWLVDRAFEGTPSRESRGHVPGWRLARTLRRMRGSADLVVARVARVSAARLGFDDDWLSVPDWIGMRLEAPFDLEAIARRSHSAGDDIRRARRDWTAEESHRDDDFAAFYRGMYFHFVRNRHRGEAHVRSMRRLRRVFRHGGLLWVLRCGERVAGLLFRRRGPELDAVAVGVAGDEDAALRSGAVAALYVHLIELARSSGCAAIDWHGSRPSLADGVTRYKRKWGMVVYDRPEVLHTTLLRWERMTPTVLAFLTRTPLVFHDVDGLSALAVAGGDDAAALPRTFERMRIPGLRRIIVLASSLPASERAADGCVPVLVTAVDASPRALHGAMQASIAPGADA